MLFYNRMPFYFLDKPAKYQRVWAMYMTFEIKALWSPTTHSMTRLSHLETLHFLLECQNKVMLFYNRMPCYFLDKPAKYQWVWAIYMTFEIKALWSPTTHSVTRLSHLETLRFLLKYQNVLTSKFWPHLIQRFVVINLCGKILSRRQVFEAEQGVPVTSTSPAWIMLNNLWYITDHITLQTLYNFTVAKVKGKCRVWGFYGTAACRPIVPLPPNDFPSFISRGAKHHIGTRDLC